MNWRHERAQEIISLLSEKGMWDKEPLDKVKWKEPQTMANCNLTFMVFERQWTEHVCCPSPTVGSCRMEVHYP